MSRRLIRISILAISGLALAAILLWLVARRIDLDQASRLLNEADRSWITIGALLYALAVALRGWRWHILLSFRATLRISDTAIALVVGYAVNNLMPARLGEVVRADVLKRRSSLSRAAALGSIFVERALDLAMVLALLIIGLMLAPHRSGAIEDALAVAAAVSCAAIVGVVALTRSRKRFKAAAPAGSVNLWQRVRRYIWGRLEDFADSLLVVSSWRFALAVLLTLPIWLVESLAIWCICSSIGLEPTIPAMIMVMSVASLSTLLPSAPGYVGGYQLAYVLALGLWNIGATQAAVAATSVIIYLMGGLTVAGALTWLVFVAASKPVTDIGK